MTREEAIKYLKKMKDECNDTFHKVRYVTKEEALEIAIQALEQTQAVRDAIAEIEQINEFDYPKDDRTLSKFKGIVIYIIQKHTKVGDDDGR